MIAREAGAAAGTGVPPRIWVLGPPGAGKSTVANDLARLVGAPATHLDDVHWEPGWKERPWEEFVARVEPVLAGDRWVVEGNYVVVRSRFLARADLVLWLDLPLSVCFPRLVVRTADRAVHGTTCCNGNRERILQALTPTKESILWWALTTDRRRRRDYEREMPRDRTVRLRTPGRVARWLSSVRAPARASDPAGPSR